MDCCNSTVLSPTVLTSTYCLPTLAVRSVQALFSLVFPNFFPQCSLLFHQSRLCVFMVVCYTVGVASALFQLAHLLLFNSPVPALKLQPHLHSFLYCIAYSVLLFLFSEEKGAPMFKPCCTALLLLSCFSTLLQPNYSNYSHAADTLPN